MSSTVRNSSGEDITAQWALAERMAGHNTIAEDALRCLFTGAMQAIEKIANKTFDDTLKERVWSKVSVDRLKTLKDFFLMEFCSSILGGFKSSEVQEMLDEHTRTGVIRNKMYSAQLQVGYHFCVKEITDSVVNLAGAMNHDWIPEIVKAVKEEGIQLPEPAQ